jgi:NDP-sugar pyrophosphorylase family protein
VWEPVGEKRNIFNQEMQRIIAIRDACFTAKDGSEFHVSKDTYGGWIADPNKVSAVSWVDRTSIIFDDATVKGRSVVADKSYVMDSGSVEDNAMISETVVNGNAAVKYNALCRQSVIADHAVVTSGAKVWKSSIGGTAHIGGQCSVMLSQIQMGHIHGDAQLRGIAIGYAPEDAQLRDVTTTDGYVSIYTGVFGVKNEAIWNNMYNEALNDGISPGHRRLGEMRGFLQGAAATAGKRL